MKDAMLKALEPAVAAAAAEAVRREVLQPGFRQAVGLPALGPETAWALWARARDPETREFLAARLVELASRGRLSDRLLKLVLSSELRLRLVGELRPWMLPRLIRVGADEGLVRAVAARTRDPEVLGRAAEEAVLAGRDELAQELARLAVNREIVRVRARGRPAAAD